MVPLTEDCGLIEWVPATVTLRSAATGTYEEQGRMDRRLTLAAIKKAYDGFTVRGRPPARPASLTPVCSEGLGLIPKPYDGSTARGCPPAYPLSLTYPLSAFWVEGLAETLRQHSPRKCLQTLCHSPL